MKTIEIACEDGRLAPLSEIPVHPAAELFPLLHGPELAELVNDIREHGLRESIAFTPDGQLLDGRNRYRACAVLGAQPKARVEPSEPWAYVISTNVHRRHLTESQRAMIAARIAERHRGSNQYSVRAGREDAPIGASSSPPPSKREAAALLNVGTSSVDRARQIVQHGVEGLQRAVEDGSVKVYTAARVASELGPAEQEEYVRRVANGADATRIAPPDTEYARRLRAARNSAGESPTSVERNNRSPKRHQYVTVPNVEALLHSLDGMAIVLDATGARIDPSITNEEAARLADGLSEGIRHARRLQKLLNEHQENINVRAI